MSSFSIVVIEPEGKVGVALWGSAQPGRRSSGVEHTLGKGGVEGSIPSGGTIAHSYIPGSI